MVMKTVKEIVEFYDNSEEPFSEIMILDKIKGEITKVDESDIISLAELHAFQFVVTNNIKTNSWGTYYGPFSESRISKEMLEYWKLRASESKHPILKSRYADLVWDLSKIITGENPDYKFANIVIENNIALSKKRMYKNDIGVIHKLKRALELALSLNDNNRSIEVKNSILNYEDTIGEDDKPGTWGFSFDILFKEHRSLLSDEDVLRIITSLEGRIHRLKTDKNSSNINPWAIEAAANRLAKYYKNLDKIDEVKRVLCEVKNAFMLKSQTSIHLQKMEWLKDVYNLYFHFGLKQDAERLKIEIKRMGPDILKEMKEVSGEVKIPVEKIEACIKKFITGSIDEVLERIAIHYIPRKDEAKKQLKELSCTAPLSFLMPTDLIDEKGRLIATIGSINDDPEGNIIHQISQYLSYKTVFLGMVLDRLKETSKLNLIDVQNFIFKSTLFEESRRSLVTKGIEAFLQKDYISSIHILVPQIENALRLLMENLGGDVLKSPRSGGFQYKTFDELLRDEKVESALDSNCSLYFRVLFTDQRGWNIRNKVCHGIAPCNFFNQSIADRVFHSLLIIGLIRKCNKEI